MRGVCVFRRVIFSRLSIAKLYTALTPRLCDYADSRTIGKWSIARSQPNLPGPTDHYRYDNIGVRFSKAFSSMFIFIRDSCREHYQNNTQSAFVRNDYERYIVVSRFEPVHSLLHTLMCSCSGMPLHSSVRSMPNEQKYYFRKIIV